MIFAQVFIQYFIIATDYGFNLTATREISINRDQPEKISQLFSAVLYIKIAFMLTSGMVLFLVIFFIPIFRAEWLVYTLAFGMVIGNVLFPVWLFQGLEKMKYITLINVLSKSIFALSIFIFIRDTSHYPYVLALHSLGFIAGGILSLWLAYTRFQIRISRPGWPVIMHNVRSGWYMFISNISVNLYKTSDLFILGLLVTEKLLGYYAIVKKLIEVSNQFAVIMSQTVYPHISQKIRESFADSMVFIQKVSVITVGVTLLMGVIFFIFAEPIVKLLAGEAFPESVLVLRLLAIVPLIVGLSVPPTQILLGAGLDRTFSVVVVMAEIISLLLNISLIHWFQHTGAATAVILMEMMVTGLLFYQVNRNRSKIKTLSRL